MIPIDVDHCRVIFDFNFSDVSEAGRAYNEQSVAVGNRVQGEDLGICEAVQRGLKSQSARRNRWNAAGHERYVSGLGKGATGFY
ncbi:MAG: SRPBCC family protein [Terriglobales bacterium]